MSVLLVVEKQTGKSPYEQIRELRSIQWPAPTAEIARHGGTDPDFYIIDHYDLLVKARDMGLTPELPQKE